MTEAVRQTVPESGQQIVHFHHAPQIVREFFPHPETGAPMVCLKLWDAHHDVDARAHLLEVVFPAESLQHEAFTPPQVTLEPPERTNEKVRRRRAAVKKSE